MFSCPPDQPSEHPGAQSAPDFELQSFPVSIPLSLSPENAGVASPDGAVSDSTRKHTPIGDDPMNRERRGMKGGSEDAEMEGECDNETDADGERSVRSGIKAHAISASNDESDSAGIHERDKPRRSLVILKPDLRGNGRGHERGTDALDAGDEREARGRLWSASLSFGNRLRFWRRERERDGPMTPT